MVLERAFVLPPALVLESLAQVGGIVLVSKARQDDPAGRFVGLFAGGSEFRFHRSPTVGEQLILMTVLSHTLASIYRFEGEVFVGAEKIAEGQILLSFSRSPE
jgi:3-hydroxymyristoyl/3-hydroxydecanoyl-(acyl carrier protein) dehydratase